jgi:hypothetical protein
VTLLIQDLRIGQLVRYSRIENDPDPNVSKVFAVTPQVVTLYTGHVHQPWVLHVQDDGTLVDEHGQRVFVWSFGAID